jgi:hypothetical protein
VPDEDWYCQACEEKGEGSNDRKPAAKDEDVSTPLEESWAECSGPLAIGSLVWGKFTGYPWWPGQVVDLSQVAELAPRTGGRWPLTIWPSQVAELATRKELHAARQKSLGSAAGHLVQFFGDEVHAVGLPRPVPLGLTPLSLCSNMRGWAPVSCSRLRTT